VGDPGDKALVVAALNGDGEAFGQLYDRYGRLVHAICYDSTRNSADAADLAQEAFLRAHARLDHLHEPENFAPWLTVITRNVCREHRRKMARSKISGVELDTERIADTDAIERDEQRQRIDDLNLAISKLPERESLALRTFYLENEDVPRTCKILGTSRSGLYRVLATAREHVAQLMRPE
jgi:RNA polymerase sigma-70 factor, ECF subfamily